MTTEQKIEKLIDELVEVKNEEKEKEAELNEKARLAVKWDAPKIKHQIDCLVIASSDKFLAENKSGLTYDESEFLRNSYETLLDEKIKK